MYHILDHTKATAGAQSSVISHLTVRRDESFWSAVRPVRPGTVPGDGF